MKTITLSVLLSTFCLLAASQDVVEWRGPNRDGIYKETGLLRKWPEGGPKLLWHFEGLGDGHTSAVITEKAIYTSGMVNGKGNIYAFDHNGKLLWKKEYGTEWTENHYGVRSTPLYVNGKLYFMSSFGQLFCMNADNGSTIWNVDLTKEYGARNITWGLTENLLHDGNVLYCTIGGTDVSMIALDMSTGKPVWKSKGNGELSAYCSPIMVNTGGRKIIVTCMQNSIVGFDAKTGNQLWKSPFSMDPDVHPNIPYFRDGYLYCSSGYGLGSKMLKLSADGSSVSDVWKDETCDPKIGGTVVLNDRIYGMGDRYRKFFVLDWKTGKEVFSSRQLAPGNIIANDGLLYVYSEAGTVNLVEPTDAGINILSSFKVPYGANPHWSHLVISNKKLYVRHGTSLMVYDVAAR
ncbi:MAG TPA: PQQ-binding-like beta-propeller repeat protein [Bacteroidales bacterium]|nr:PQQ-binding-like beta-propeller repeat protein [Bacteroidales bacterium]